MPAPSDHTVPLDHVCFHGTFRSITGRGVDATKTTRMIRPCVAKGFSSVYRLTVLHQCIRSLIGACSAPGHHGYQRACVLLLSPPGFGRPTGHETFATVLRRRRHQRSVIPWCDKPVSQLDLGFLEHLGLSPRTVVCPGACLLEFLFFGTPRRRCAAWREVMELLHQRCCGLDRSLWTVWVTSVRRRREDRSSISSHPLADPRRETDCRTTSSPPSYLFSSFVRATRPFLRPGLRLFGASHAGPSRLAALRGHPQGLGLDGPEHGDESD
jgi:hypothetical protein